LRRALIEREDVGRTNLELTLPPAIVGVALVEGLAARGAHFEHEAALLGVEEIDFHAPRRARGGLNKTTTEFGSRHRVLTRP
jgi:hypothetical protein